MKFIFYLLQLISLRVLNHYKKWDNFLSWLSWCLAYICTRNVFSFVWLFFIFIRKIHTDTHKYQHWHQIFEFCILNVVIYGPKYFMFYLTLCSKWIVKCSFANFFPFLVAVCKCKCSLLCSLLGFFFFSFLFYCFL